MNKIKYTLVLGILLLAFNLNAQNQSDMLINEVLITNTSDFQDDFGQHSAWIELFNTSYGTVNIGGCFISNDKNNLMMYSIPKGDILTRVKPRQHTLFWADNQPKRGTFHLNFNIKEGDIIYFVSSDGRTIIDQITIPALAENISYGRIDDGIGTRDGNKQDWSVLDHTSPSTNNSAIDGETKAMVMKRTDPYGIMMALIAMSVVFLALIVLFFIFKFIGILSIRRQQKQVNKASTATSPEKTANVQETSAETYAAIATALHLYNMENESHDDESFTLTMSHTDRSYSPWSSKIYGLRQNPDLKVRKR